ncbi:16949_t:CDS:2 [Rhizophagus irregularis]|nr:16949_t:CDS:2 [Rhizophagus irregularis]
MLLIITVHDKHLSMIEFKIDWPPLHKHPKILLTVFGSSEAISDIKITNNTIASITITQDPQCRQGLDDSIHNPNMIIETIGSCDQEHSSFVKDKLVETVELLLIFSDSSICLINSVLVDSVFSLLCRLNSSNHS